MDISNYKKTITELTQDLAKLEIYANDLKMENTQKTLRELNERIKNDRFNVAVLGEFRRGKSTLINALLRTPVLPSDIVPTTASVNRITYDPQPRARVEYFDGSTENIDIRDLADYATQEGDKSGNVKEVVVWYPTVYCANNVDIYDTPGLNDSAAMTEATMKVIDRMDIAIFTLMANIPFSMSECEFIGEKLLTSNVGRVVFVVTRMGEYTPEQQERILNSVRKRISEMVLAKAERVYSDRPDELEEFKRKLDDIRVFGVDSVMALEARKNYDARLLEKSGFTAFEMAIDELLTRERGQVMLEKQTGAIMKSANDIFNVIQTRTVPLTMDESEFGARCEKANTQIATIEGSLNNELARLEQAAAELSEKTKTEWATYVAEMKAELENIANTVEISMKDLTPKGRERMTEGVWTNHMAPAINSSLQVYSEKIQNNVAEAIGKECKKLDEYADSVSCMLDEFTGIFAPQETIGEDGKGQVLSFALLGVGGLAGYKVNGVKGAIVGGLGGGLAIGATSFALAFTLAAVGVTITAPITLAITAAAALVGSLTGKKLTQRLFWKDSAKRFREDLAEIGCKQLDELLEKTDFETTINTYIAEVFDSIKKEITNNTTGALKDIQKALQDTRENFAAEKAQADQKMQSYTAILESLSAITSRTAAVREAYGLS